MRLWKEEIFGPVLSIGTFDSFDQAIEMADETALWIVSFDLHPGYQQGVFRYARRIYRHILCERPDYLVPNVGRDEETGKCEAATAALDVYSEWKSVYVDFSGALQRAQIDNA